MKWLLHQQLYLEVTTLFGGFNNPKFVIVSGIRVHQHFYLEVYFLELVVSAC